MLFCTELTFDLILRLGSIFRLGIHPYVFYHTSRSTMSMDAIIDSILPSEEFFRAMDCWLSEMSSHLSLCYIPLFICIICKYLRAAREISSVLINTALKSLLWLLWKEDSMQSTRNLRMSLRLHHAIHAKSCRHMKSVLKFAATKKEFLHIWNFSMWKIRVLKFLIVKKFST